MKSILFLGDSITDCEHCFTPDNLGNGYVKMIAEHMNRDLSLSDQKEPYRIVNGGTDGFTFPSIYRKWKQSYASQTFDIISILGGINDTALIMDTGLSKSQIQAQIMNSGLALKKLLDELIRREPSCILVAEPFLFPYPEYLCAWAGRLEQIRSMIRRTVRACTYAQDSHTDIRLLSLQPLLDAYATDHGYPAVTTDGIHLTDTGHRIVSRQLLHAVIPSEAQQTTTQYMVRG